LPGVLPACGGITPYRLSGALTQPRPAQRQQRNLPATAVPAGLTSRSQPVGVQIIGPRCGNGHIRQLTRSVAAYAGALHDAPLYVDISRDHR
jgi:hypothetical protein